MVDKTRFISENDASAELPAKCCARCVHSREQRDPAQLKTMHVCKALSPVPLLMMDPRTRQPIIQSVWPVMDATAECDLFSSRPPSNPVN